MSTDKVWTGLPREEWTLWNARLFPVTTVDEAWRCTLWMLRLPGEFSVEQWNQRELLSLGTGAQYADGAALEAARSRRLKAAWRTLALSLVDSGADIRPF